MSVIGQAPLYRESAGKRDPGYFLDEEKKRIREGIEILKKEIRINWEKKYQGEKIFPASFSNVSPEAVDFLLSFELVKIYDEIARSVELDAKQRDALPQIVWKALLSGKIEKASEMFNGNLQMTQQSAETFFELMEEKILCRLRKLSSRDFVSGEAKAVISTKALEQESVKVEKIPLEKALLEFPKLGEQLITSAPLKLRIFPEMVKPSVKNWIADYHDALGKGKHGTMERGNYLFHGENTKRLTSLERRRLAEVLKSLDDGSELSIDARAQKIIFENKTQEYDAPVQDRPAISSARPTVQQKTQASYMTPASQVSVNAAQPPRQAVPARPSSESERKVENYFGGNSASRSAYDFGAPAKPASISAGPTAPVFPKPVSAPAHFRGNLPVGDVQDHYEIPKKQNENSDGVKNSWNPAESVRKRMSEESSSFGPSQIGQQKKESSLSPQGNLRFSSPQTLPVEKKQEALKTVPPNTYAALSRPAESIAKPASAVHSVSPKPPVSEQVQGEDDLMAKMRALKNQQTQKTNPRAVYKITPMGFVKKTDEELLVEKDGKGPKVNGNVVDLR